MNTLLTACILEARSPGITEQWPLMVLEPIEKTRHEVWMGHTLPIKLELAAVPPGKPRMHGPARQFSSWKDACEAMGWLYTSDHRAEDAANAEPFVVIQKGRAVGATTLALEQALGTIYQRYAPNVAMKRYIVSEGAT